MGKIGLALTVVATLLVIAVPAYAAAVFFTPFLGVIVAVCLAIGVGVGRAVAARYGNNAGTSGGGGARRSQARQSKGARGRRDR